MPYLIDGHNLVPAVGLRLDSLDDEQELLTRLQEFCRLSRAKVEVYFDGAPPGMASTQKAGVVTAHFIRKSSSADAAIVARLLLLKKAARNWTVVSSDARVQKAARAAHAAVLSGSEFARKMENAQRSSRLKPSVEPALSPGQVEDWLQQFKQRGK
jgi:uncharacterized protein